MRTFKIGDHVTWTNSGARPVTRTGEARKHCEELTTALRSMASLVESVAEQQAMHDDSWKPEINSVFASVGLPGRYLSEEMRQ